MILNSGGKSGTFELDPLVILVTSKLMLNVYYQTYDYP